MDKVIALLDLDYFYAQAETLRKPELVGKPVVIVMPSLRENSGAIATCNYEARALKIRSGMALGLAKKLANSETAFINADKPYYEELSRKVFEVVDFFCEKVEQVSIDEAYFELTNPFGFDKAEEICVKIKQMVKAETGLTCSIGLSVNKLLAKMAAGARKPDGFFVIKPSEVQHFLSKERVGELFGVGPKAEEILKYNHIHFVADLQRVSREKLVEWFGEAKGLQLFDFALGVDTREVLPNREKQQLSRMITLEQDSRDLSFIKQSTDFLCDRVFSEATHLNKSFKTASLVIISSAFETTTKSKTKSSRIISTAELTQIIDELLKDFLDYSLVKVRRVGVKVSNFSEDKGMQRKLGDY